MLLECGSRGSASSAFTHEQQLEPSSLPSWASRSPVPLAHYVDPFHSGGFGPKQCLPGPSLLATCHPLPASLAPTETANREPCGHPPYLSSGDAFLSQVAPPGTVNCTEASGALKLRKRVPMAFLWDGDEDSVK